jgi:hypothetical protein
MVGGPTRKTFEVWGQNNDEMISPMPARMQLERSAFVTPTLSQVDESSGSIPNRIHTSPATSRA